MTSAFCLLLISTLMAGCDLNNPTSPNTPGQLTGQTTNQSFTFNGTIGVLAVSGTVIADDNSTVTIIATVRDQSGNPIPNLTQVTFTTNLGAFLVADGSGALVQSTTATGVTFNGQAQAFFASFGRTAGTATITASLGNTAASTHVQLKPAPIQGTIALRFGTSILAGTITKTGVASTATPLDAEMALEALDFEGAPIVAANVSFRILQDTTADNTANPNAEFVASRHTATGSEGDAANILRAFGPGVVVVVAELFDPNSGELVGTSNRIILTTETTYLVSQQFDDGSTTFTLAAGALPGTVGITAAVTNTDGAPQPGLTVRFTIIADSTSSGASLSSSLVVSNAGGLATTSVTVPDNGGGAGSSVSILAEVVNSAGTTLATSNVIVAIGSP